MASSSRSILGTWIYEVGDPAGGILGGGSFPIISISSFYDSLVDTSILSSSSKLSIPSGVDLMLSHHASFPVTTLGGNETTTTLSTSTGSSHVLLHIGINKASSSAYSSCLYLKLYLAPIGMSYINPNYHNTQPR